MHLRTMLRPAALTLLCSWITAAAPLAAQTPHISWTRQFGAKATDQAHAVGYGEFGVYTAGEAHGEFPGQTSAGNLDAFISLHDESGVLKWIRQFGTPAEDVATGVAGDGSGAYVVGYTSGSFGSQVGSTDAFLRKYDPNGNVLWTRQFGTVVDDYAFAVATHSSGVYVVGQIDCCGATFPPGMPTQSADGFIQKYSGDGTLLWTRMISTENAEKALGVAVDESGVYVVGTTNGELMEGPGGGRDGFLRKYGHDGAKLWTRQFGTRLPTGESATDDANAVAVGAGGVYVAGATAGGAGPASTFSGGLWDAFLIKFDPSDGSPQWYRQIGTDGDDYGYAIAEGAGHVLITGGTSANLVDGAFVGGEDAFFRLYDLDGNVLGTQQFGDGLNDSVTGAVVFSSGFFVAGTKSGTALEQEVAGDNDSFVMRLVPPPHVGQGRVVNGASFASPAPLAPGSMALVQGAYLNDGPPILSTSLTSDGKVVTSLGGTRVLVNNIPAPILYSTASDVMIQIPFELAGQTIALVVVQVGTQFSEGRGIGVAPAAPGIFTMNQMGTGEAIAFHEDGVTIVSAQNPARRGEMITLYGTGFGVLNPALGTGVPAGANVAQAQVTIEFGVAAGAVEYVGSAPGFVGTNQLNVRIPDGAPSGSDVPISLRVGGRSANGVTIAIGR